ncbi:hypothetical protein [Rheinheimera hassiensis]|uniref:hypothetical protein n=1 Tax=Rheinheimera hassiensis TaxID=1193627 RepID=UPI001F06654E|nr:hypothetical protein [Rheinheimera hassiensis]
MNIYDSWCAYAKAKDLDLSSLQYEVECLVHLSQINGVWKVCREQDSLLTGFIPEFDFEHLIDGDHPHVTELLHLFIPTVEFRYYLKMQKQVSCVTVTNCYIAGHVDFWLKKGRVWLKCSEDVCEWISLPTEENEVKTLNCGFPKLFVYMELAKRERKFSGRTPDMCETVEEFLEFYQPGITELSRKSKQVDWPDEDGFFVEHERTISYKGSLFSVTHLESKHIEGHTRKTEWKRDGNYHHMSGFAVVDFLNPFIPSEGYLAKDECSRFVNGVLIEELDKTFETIVSRWPSPQRAYFGYD